MPSTPPEERTVPSEERSSRQNLQKPQPETTAGPGGGHQREARPAQWEGSLDLSRALPLLPLRRPPLPTATRLEKQSQAAGVKRAATWAGQSRLRPLRDRYWPRHRGRSLSEPALSSGRDDGGSLLPGAHRQGSRCAATARGLTASTGGECVSVSSGRRCVTKPRAPGPSATNSFSHRDRGAGPSALHPRRPDTGDPTLGPRFAGL